MNRNPIYETRSTSVAAFLRVVLGSKAHLSTQIEGDGRTLFAFDDSDDCCYGLNMAYHSSTGYSVNARSLMDEAFAVRGTNRKAHDYGSVWENPSNV